MVCAQFFCFRNFIHDGIVVLQQPPPLFHVVRFQNLLTGFLKKSIVLFTINTIHIKPTIPQTIESFKSANPPVYCIA